MVQDYITDIIFPAVGDGINYSLRNRNSLTIPFTRTENHVSLHQLTYGIQLITALEKQIHWVR